MPKDGDPLPPEQVALIKQWIEEGANYDGGDPKAALTAIMPPPTHRAAPQEYRSAIPITAIAFSTDGKELFAGGYHELTVWNPENGQLVRRIGNVGERTYQIAQSRMTHMTSILFDAVAFEAAAAVLLPKLEVPNGT